MIDSWFSKSKLIKGVEKLVKKILVGRISANQLTIIGFVIGLLSAFFIFLSGITQFQIELIIISALLMLLSFSIDILDGTVARFENPTIFGGILDIFCDRIVEISIIIAIISTDPINLVWPGVFSLGAIVLCITMFLVVGGALKADQLEESQKVIYYRKGLMERTETFLFLLIIIVFFPWRVILLWIFAILVFITAILRFRDAYLLFYSKNKNT